MNKNIIKVNEHSYVYSDKFEIFNFIPGVEENIEKDQFAEYRDKSFWDKSNYFESSSINFQTQYSSDKIEANLANLRQLLIEVTDGCNLQCKYCGYGDLYANYDKRESKLQQFSNVKPLIDHLVKLWCSEYNTSYDKDIVIGFYGGEPLLNIHV